ncbi:hypothetical protein NKI78_27060 [Mesorhizobium sp. M0400]|uniref:hypothetical protein n=1 Tax=Mesorhizobium sp. M0400 TaxID=2956941 RepID=UPI00333A135C
MPKNPADEMLPAVKGLQIDLNDKDHPSLCLVGLITEEGVKSFALHPTGAGMMIQGLQTFLNLVGTAKGNTN